MKIVYDSYILLPFLALFIGLVLVIRIWRHRNLPISKTLIVLMTGLVFWSAAAVMERITIDLASKIFWMQMTYVGRVSTPVAWLVCTLQYTEREKWVTGRKLALLCIIPVITLVMVWTNSLHHLVWKDAWLNFTLYPPAVEVTHNIWFLVYTLCAYSMLLAGTLCLIISYRRSLGIYRKQLGIILIVALIPWVCNFLFISGILSFSVLDPTPLALAFSGIVFSEGLSRFHLLDALPIAQDTIYRSIVDGVIIIDTENRIIEKKSC